MENMTKLLTQGLKNFFYGGGLTKRTFWFQIYPSLFTQSLARITSCKLRVQTYELTYEYELRLQIQEHEFKTTYYELKSTSFEFKSTSYKFKSTSYEFKSTS